MKCTLLLHTNFSGATKRNENDATTFTMPIGIQEKLEILKKQDVQLQEALDMELKFLDTNEKLFVKTLHDAQKFHQEPTTSFADELEESVLCESESESDALDESESEDSVVNEYVKESDDEEDDEDKEEYEDEEGKSIIEKEALTISPNSCNSKHTRNVTKTSQSFNVLVCILVLGLYIGSWLLFGLPKQESREL